MLQIILQCVKSIKPVWKVVAWNAGILFEDFGEPPQLVFGCQPTYPDKPEVEVLFKILLYKECLAYATTAIYYDKFRTVWFQTAFEFTTFIFTAYEFFCHISLFCCKVNGYIWFNQLFCPQTRLYHAYLFIRSPMKGQNLYKRPLNRLYVYFQGR